MSELIKTQKLLSNKDLLLRNFSELIYNLQECEGYINDVLEGKLKGDPEVGRMLNHCMSQFSTDDMKVLENMIKENFEDAIMISSLAKLQKA